MQVINKTLKDLKNLEIDANAASENKLIELDDNLFLRASIAQSNAIAGLALAIMGIKLQDTFGLTPHAAEQATTDALLQDIMEIVRHWISSLDENPANLERALRERLVR